MYTYTEMKHVLVNICICAYERLHRNKIKLSLMSIGVSIYTSIAYHHVGLVYKTKTNKRP